VEQKFSLCDPIFPSCFHTDFQFICTDDKILVNLGIECPSSDEAERGRWSSELKLFSEQLRAEKTRDPEFIAKKLVEFRRRFIGDDSKVLKLGDVVI
jgi:hypothetical protein